MSSKYSSHEAWDTSDGQGVPAAPVVVKAPESHRSHRRHHRRRRRRRIIIGCVAAFVLITAVSAFAFTTLINQGRLNLLTLSNAQLGAEESAVVTDNGKIVEYQGHKYRLNENMISLCVIGRDKELHTQEDGFNGQADFIMDLAIDSRTGKMTGIVIPRDSMVDVDVNYIGTDKLYDVEKMQLCLQYAYGANDQASSELVARAVSRVLYNVPLDFYYTMNMEGIYELTDLVGGVTVEALETIPDTNIVAGEVTKLDGYSASKYVQWRDTSQLQTALNRQARQMQYVNAVADKALVMAKGNPSMIIDMYNVVSKYATTNLTASEVSYLAPIMVNGNGGFSTTVLKGDSVVNEDSEWEQFILDKESVYQTVLDVYYVQID